MKCLFKLVVAMIVIFSMAISAWADDMITYDAVTKTVSAQIPDDIPFAEVLKEFGQKTGIKVSVEKNIVDSKVKAISLSFGGLSIPEAVAALTAPYYFKIFVTSLNIADANSEKTPVSLIVYRKWKNNEPREVLYAGLTKKTDIDANARIIGSNGKITDTKAGVKDWDPGDTSSYFTYKHYDVFGSDQWIDETKNPAISGTANGTVMFAYILGKANHSSALVRAHAKRETITGTSNVLTFTFDIIKGQLDNDFESIIDYFTQLSVPNKYSNAIALKTNAETLPSWEEIGGSDVNMPDGSYFIKDHNNRDGWTFEFTVTNNCVDDWGVDEPQICATLTANAYYLAYVRGGNGVGDTNGFAAFCLVHVNSSADKARLLVLDDAGFVDNDFDVFVNEFTIVENLTAENENFDNVVYKKYQDMFLLNPIDKTSANSPLVADYLPSHLLYSIEDYLWDTVRFKVVANGSEVADPYIDSNKNAEGTVGKMFRDFKNNTSDIPADSARTPIIFIHGWQGDKSNGFDILKGYGLKMFGDIQDTPSSGEEYWRNLLTYMYKYHADVFKNYKPYIYHHPSYKHVTFNARMLEDLINDLRANDACLGNGYNNNKIILIGHSMGTIISRSVMEEHNLYSHVQKFISLAGVHHGSPGAIGSLVDTTIAASWFAGKDFYSPGACDLISDNYDGFIGTAIKADIQSNNWAAWELMGQRAQAGCLYEDGDFYSNKASFDLHYINQITGGPTGNPANNFNWYVKDQEVPIYSNPWLLNMNQKFITNYQNTADKKYIFYTGYLVTAPTAGLLTFPKVPESPLWTNTLSGSIAMNIAGVSVSGASSISPTCGYWFTDSCVPLSYGILDSSRGRLLQSNGSISNSSNTVYDKNGMEDIPVLGDLFDSAETRNKLEATYFYKVDNNWGAPTRIVYDHDHDQMLQGGYDDVMLYRQNNIGQGQSYKKAEYFTEYSTYVHPGKDIEMRFAYDPVFEQIRFDIVSLVTNDGGAQCQEAGSSAGWYWYNNTCNYEPQNQSCADNLNLCATKTECETDAGGVWCGGECVTDLSSCPEDNCVGAGGIWCDNSCNTSDQLITCPEADCADAGGHWCSAVNECRQISQPCDAVCDAEHRNLCITETACEDGAVNGIWCGDLCREPDDSQVYLCTDSEQCISANGTPKDGGGNVTANWCNDTICQSEICTGTSTCSDNLDLCENVIDCKEQDGYWYQNKCYKYPECKKATISSDLNVFVPYMDVTAYAQDSNEPPWEANLQYSPIDGRILFKVTGEIPYSTDILGKNGENCELTTVAQNGNVHIPNIYSQIPGYEKVFSVDGIMNLIGDGVYYEIDNATVNEIISSQCGTYNVGACITKSTCQTEGFNWCYDRQCQETPCIEEICSLENLDLCKEQAECDEVGGYWYDNKCNAQPDTPVCDAENLDLCTSQTVCEEATGNWCDDNCQKSPCGSVCSLENLDLCKEQAECDEVGGYWYNNKCNAEPDCEVATLSSALDIYIPKISYKEDQIITATYSVNLSFVPQNARMLFEITNIDTVAIDIGNDDGICETSELLSDLEIAIPKLQIQISGLTQVVSANLVYAPIGENVYFELVNADIKELILSVLEKNQCDSGGFFWQKDKCIYNFACEPAVFSEDFDLELPIIQFPSTPDKVSYFKAGLEIVPSLDGRILFKTVNAEVIKDLENVDICIQPTLDANLKLHIPKIAFRNDAGISYLWADLKYVPDETNILFELEKIGFIEDGTAMYSFADHDTLKVLSKGTPINISLDSDRMNGASWEIVNINNSILSNTNNTYFLDCATCPGVETWNFDTLRLGTTKIEMAYSQPGKPSIKVFNLLIQVVQ